MRPRSQEGRAYFQESGVHGAYTRREADIRSSLGCSTCEKKDMPFSLQFRDREVALSLDAGHNILSD